MLFPKGTGVEGVMNRDKEKINKEQIVADLQNVPWDTAYIHEDVNDLWHHWAKLYNDVLDVNGQ